MCRTTGYIYEGIPAMMVINNFVLQRRGAVPPSREAAMATVMGSQTTHLRDRRGGGAEREETKEREEREVEEEKEKQQYD